MATNPIVFCFSRDCVKTLYSAAVRKTVNELKLSLHCRTGVLPAGFVCNACCFDQGIDWCRLAWVIKLVVDKPE